MFQTLSYRLSLLYKDFYAYAGVRLHASGLHKGWIFFMLYVGKHPGCAPAEMTKALHMDWGYSQRCVTKLAEAGFLTKEKTGRIYRLELTEKGRQVFEESQRLFQDWEREKPAGFTASERDTLQALLHRIPLDEEI